MTGKISQDPDRVLDGSEKYAAAAVGSNYGVLGSTIAAWLASLTQTLTGKTISGASNTISGLTAAMFVAGVIDTDGTLSANSDTRLATQKAVKAYADALIGAADAMVFKGVIDCSANPNYPAADRGWTYKVSVAGKIGGASGVNVEVGDTLMCITDGTASGTQGAVGGSWNIIQANIDGAVTGPASSTSGNIATFSGTGGKVIQDGGKALPSGVVVGDTDTQNLSNKTLADFTKKTQTAEAAGNGFRQFRSNGTTWIEQFMAAAGIGIAANDALNWYSNSAAAIIAALDRSGHFQTLGGIGSAHATTGVGYTTGAGGTVTQGTSKSTGVTLNKVAGQITMNAAALASAAKVSFVVTDSAVAATDTVIANVANGGTSNAYRAAVTAVAAGSFTVTVENITGGSLSESPVINFAVLKAVAS